MIIQKLAKRIVPGAFIPAVTRIRSAWRNRGHFGCPTMAIFTDIYKHRKWGNTSVSGPGADLEQTIAVRQTLPNLLKRLEVRTLLDLPCGDFNWMRSIDMNGIRYIGADIVGAIVQENKERYQNSSIEFVQLDIITDVLPLCDMLLCRDCLIHFSFRDAESALANIAKSSIKYLLTTNYPLLRKNTDIVTGDFRALNLQLDPFCLPKPEFVLQEDLFPEHRHNPNFIRELALWRVTDLPR